MEKMHNHKINRVPFSEQKCNALKESKGGGGIELASCEMKIIKLGTCHNCCDNLPLNVVQKIHLDSKRRRFFLFQRVTEALIRCLSCRNVAYRVIRKMAQAQLRFSGSQSINALEALNSNNEGKSSHLHGHRSNCEDK